MHPPLGRIPLRLGPRGQPLSVSSDIINSSSIAVMVVDDDATVGWLARFHRIFVSFFSLFDGRWRGDADNTSASVFELEESDERCRIVCAAV